jgi:hypothetical protein
MERAGFSATRAVAKETYGVQQLVRPWSAHRSYSHHSSKRATAANQRCNAMTSAGPEFSQGSPYSDRPMPKLDVISNTKNRKRNARPYVRLVIERMIKTPRVAGFSAVAVLLSPFALPAFPHDGEPPNRTLEDAL